MKFCFEYGISILTNDYLKARHLHLRTESTNHYIIETTNDNIPGPQNLYVANSMGGVMLKIKEFFRNSN